MTFAMFMGLIVSFGLVFLREQFDNRLRSAEEVSAVLGIPVLGIIPNISSQQRTATNIKDIWEKVRRHTRKAFECNGTRPANVKAQTRQQTSTRKEASAKRAKARQAVLQGSCRDSKQP